jgi:hypothetical protein
VFENGSTGANLVISQQLPGGADPRAGRNVTVSAVPVALRESVQKAGGKGVKLGPHLERGSSQRRGASC